MDLQIANPRLLLLVWAIPAVALWWFRAQSARTRALQQFMSAELQRKLAPADAPGRFRWQAGLLCAGLTLGLVAAARPQWGQREETVYQRGRDLVVALDVSRSMLATDVRPSRLQRAKTDLIDLVGELRGDRTALVAFRRGAELICPLTTDYAYFLHALDGAGPDAAPRGETDIGAAIRKALEAFSGESGAHKALILISDGEDLAGGARAAAEEAARRGIVIFTVGLGSTAGSTIPDAEQAGGQAMYQDAPVVSRLMNETLHEIATLTKGAYIPVGTASMGTATLGTLYRDHLRALSAQDLEETLQRRYVERYQWFLLPALLCLLAAAALSPGRLATRTGRRAGTPPTPVKGPAGVRDLTPPARRIKAAGVVLGLLLAGTAGAQSVGSTNAPATAPAGPRGRQLAREAQTLFQRGDYTNAAQAYLQAARTASAEGARDYRYNAAVALYTAQQYDQAADVLRPLLSERHDEVARTAEGLGAALFEAAARHEGEDAAAMKVRADRTREAAEALRLAARHATGEAAEPARRHAATALLALHEREESARIRTVLDRYQSMDAGRLATDMLQTQSQLLEATATVHTNRAPNRIDQHEALAVRQSENVDRWIALKGKLMEMPLDPAVTGQVTRATLEHIVEGTRDRMREAARHLRDVSPDALSAVAASEASFYPLWKAVAGYDHVLQQDLRLQTNALALASQPDPTPQVTRLKSEQQEALALTQLFRDRFEKQVPEEDATGSGVGPLGTPTPGDAPGGANMGPPVGAGGEPYTNRAAVIELAAQAVAVQESAMRFLEASDWEGLRAEQKLAHGILKEIEALLPRSQSQEGQQSQDSQQQQQEGEQGQEQQDGQQEQDSESTGNEQQPELPPPTETPPAEPESESQEEAAQAEEDKDAPDTDTVDRLLERALQRERQHDADLRKRRQVPPLPIERDW